MFVSIGKLRRICAFTRSFNGTDFGRLHRFGMREVEAQQLYR
jgi:hypothetical protein